MKIKLTAACILAGSLLAPMMAHADSDADRSHPMNFVKDSAITTKIKTKLAAEHLKSLKNIRVDTDENGVVWLSGSASTREQMEKAGRVARGTEGVKVVKNNILIKADD